MDTAIARNWAIPLRIILGLSFFVAHGIPKVFSAADHAQFRGFLGQLGVPAPALMAWVVGLVELLGGIALILGVLTWIAAALLTIEMTVALVLVHLPAGFEVVRVVGMSEHGPVFGMPGYELNLVYIAGLLALLIGGPGPLSVDEHAGAERPLRAPWIRGRVHA